MNPLVLALLLLMTEPAAAPAPLEYRFEAVRSKVVVTHDQVETRAAAGTTALAGDAVRTGLFGKTTLAVPSRSSRFEIFSSTRVMLAGPDPGVLIVLEKGRLKAIFDKLTGDVQRLVATPGALLAVRGTRYGIEVAADGSASLAVFEGVVEVLPRAGGMVPVRVGAGELCLFGPRMAPHPMPMPRGMTEHGWTSHGAMMGGPEAGFGGMHGPGGSPMPRPQTPPAGMGGMRH